MELPPDDGRPLAAWLAQAVTLLGPVAGEALIMVALPSGTRLQFPAGTVSSTSRGGEDWER